MDELIYSVKIDDVYVGPIDLLIDLIIKNELDIYDISINHLTNLFIEEMEKISFSNVYSFLDFSNMVATLLRIKSKTLLPTSNIIEIDDPREDLINRIVEYNYYKNISYYLQKNYNTSNESLNKKPEDFTTLSLEENIEYKNLNIDKLAKSLSRMLSKNYYLNKELDTRIHVESITVEDCIKDINKTIKNGQTILFSDLIYKSHSKEYIISYFLAALELGKAQKIRIIQKNENILLKER